METRAETPIHQAILDRNLVDLQKFLDCDVDMTRRGRAKQSPLDFACEIGAWECVIAIAKSSKPNKDDIYHSSGFKSAIFKAAKADQYEAAKALVKVCEDHNIALYDRLVSLDGNSALHWAVTHRNIPMIKLIDNADTTQVREANRDKLTPMQFAAKIKAYDCVEVLTSLHSTYDGDTTKDIYRYGGALLTAVQDKQIKSVEALLAASAPLTWTTIAEGNYALHCAVVNNDTEMVKLLLSKGAKLTQKNKFGKTPFELACDLGHFDCAELCFADKDKYTDVDGAHYGALVIYAVNAGEDALLARLLQSGASVTARTRQDNMTAMHHAAKRYDSDYVKLLLAAGASLTAVSEYGSTPIEDAGLAKRWDLIKCILAARQGKKFTLAEVESMHLEDTLKHAIIYSELNTLKLLLELGVPCNKVNSLYGNIALHYAIMFCERNPDIITLLLEHGADPNVRNKDGKTAHDYARERTAAKCLQRLTPFDTGMAEERVKDLTIKANKIFDDLFTPMQVPKLLFVNIAAYHVLQFELLENDLQALKAKRNFLNLHPETAQRETEILDKQIAIIQQLLNYPDSKAAPAPGFENTPSSRHILDYVDHSQKIHDYAERVKEFLRSISTTIQGKIDTHTWKVKSFLNVFTNKYSYGLPDHVKAIIKELKTYQDNPSDISACIAFINIGVIFARLEHNWLRHPETTQFINEQMRKIEGLHFLAPPAEVQQMEAVMR